MPNFLNNKELNSAGFSRPKPANYELCSTLVERTLQFQPFYAKQSQFPKSQVFTKYYITRTYENWTLGQLGKTKPIQTQSKPIQSQFKANQTQFQSRRLLGFLGVYSRANRLNAVSRLAFVRELQYYDSFTFIDKAEK